MGNADEIEHFIAQWRDTGGSELANTQSFINGLCHLLGVGAPAGKRVDPFRPLPTPPLGRHEGEP